jgi:6-methylpretetramide 4-monooxygenase / 4-hydroxy-6-methylpretetramide 12a-monooxygenase
LGGEGLNSGLHDAHDLAWKLALCLRGRGHPALLESFEFERLTANHHVLEVSDRVDALVRGAVDSARTGVRGSPASPTQLAALARSRCMLDVSYAASPLVGEYRGREPEPPAAPGPGDRYPDRTTLGGTTHHLLLFGATDDAGAARLRRRWRGLVDVVRATGDPRRAGLTSSGAVLVRPDGHIGFRAVPADTAGLAALDAHLDSYLTPAQ